MKKDDDYYEMAIQGCLDNGLLEEAVSVATEGIELFPEHAPLYLLRGVAHEFMHYYKEAIKDLSQFLTMHQRASTFHYRGTIYRKLGQFEQAVDDFTKAINLSGKAVYYERRAILFIEMQELEKAKVDLQQAILLDEHPHSKDAKKILERISQENMDKE